MNPTSSQSKIQLFDIFHKIGSQIKTQNHKHLRYCCVCNKHSIRKQGIARHLYCKECKEYITEAEYNERNYSKSYEILDILNKDKINNILSIKSKYRYTLYDKNRNKDSVRLNYKDDLEEFKKNYCISIYWGTNATIRSRSI